MNKLKAPFPYFGGKQMIASMVWERFGNPRNYAEPFAGTAAVLLRRPVTGEVETINDANHYVVNFWRAVQTVPDHVAHFADSPVTEADLHARHRFLMFSDQAKKAFARVAEDPEFYDARLAGWWVWGQCCWIGGGWCTSHGTVAKKKPATGNSQHLAGVHGDSKLQIPDLSGDGGAFGRGVTSSAGHNKRPVLASDRETRGVATVAAGRPQLGDAYDIGRGVNSNGKAGTVKQRQKWLKDWMFRLADRLRLVRVCYGHWNRICDSSTTMTRLGDTAVFLDPPYAKNLERLHAFLNGQSPSASTATNRAETLYSNDDSQDVDALVAEVNQWCQRWGNDSKVKIALCGYDGEHNNLEQMGWEKVAWKAQGGYANRNTENQNKGRERIWFSPGCGQPEGMLF